MFCLVPYGITKLNLKDKNADRKMPKNTEIIGDISETPVFTRLPRGWPFELEKFGRKLGGIRY